jgi:hypothetical protein
MVGVLDAAHPQNRCRCTFERGDHIATVDRRLMSAQLALMEFLGPVNSTTAFGQSLSKTASVLLD